LLETLVTDEHEIVTIIEGEGASAVIKRYGHASPGIHVDGVESWLYPIQPTDVAS
jgi:hypothetical protein